MRSLVALTTLFLLAVLCGCGNSLPSERDGEQAVKEMFAGKDGQQVDNKLRSLDL